MNAAFWKGKRVFVTGHTGFKGSWLCLWLQRHGAMLAGYALAPPTDPSLFDQADVGAGMQSTIADIRDLAALTDAVRAFQPEIVLHLAAQALVRDSYADPVGTYATNVLGTVHLLDAVRQTPGVRVVVNVTSDKCYENREWLWGYREDEAMGGHDPYSSSKGCAELVASAWRRSFFAGPDAPRLASARAGNVIGGGDWARDRLVPDLLAYMERGEPVPIRNPAAIRPWQHVLEPLHGYLMLAEALWNHGDDFADGWNFGPDETSIRPVSYVADVLVRAWGNGARWEQDRGHHPHEARLLKLDSSKARARLGWTPRLDLDEALDWIVNWQRGFLAGRPARELVERDLQAFEAVDV